MDSLEALRKLRLTSKDLESSAHLLSLVAQALEEGCAAADWLALQPVLEFARVFAFQLNLEGHVESVSGGLTQVLGLHQDEFRGRRFLDLIDPAVYEDEPLEFLNSDEHPTEPLQTKMALLHRSGWRVWIELTLVPAFSSGGKVSGYRALAVDSSRHQQEFDELQQALEHKEQELEEAQSRPTLIIEDHSDSETDLWQALNRRQQSTLLAGMARVANMLAHGEQRDESVALTWAIERLSDLTRLSREPEGWAATGSFAPLEEMERAAALFRREGSDQSLSGKLEVDNQLPLRIDGNVLAWRAALLEIFQWASTALPFGGLVVALGNSPDGHLQAVFKCYGLVEEVGESPEQSLELRELATCRKFLKVLGGRLRVDRFLDGIEVQLSLTAQEASSQADRSHRISQPGGGLTILLAEDDQVARKVAVRTLKNLGHSVDAVTTGLEVLQAATERDYDVVLLDVQMPDMDGLDAARQLRRRFFPCPYLIALTSGNTAADRRRVMEAGMHDFLAKPLRAEDLRDALSQIPFYTTPGER